MNHTFSAKNVVVAYRGGARKVKRAYFQRIFHVFTVGREVSVAPYRGGDTLQYLILDPSTDKTIVKY